MQNESFYVTQLIKPKLKCCVYYATYREMSIIKNRTVPPLASTKYFACRCVYIIFTLCQNFLVMQGGERSDIKGKLCRKICF